MIRHSQTKLPARPQATAKEDKIRRIARTRPYLILALLAFGMLLAAACVGFNRPEGWAGPAEFDDLLVATTDTGEISALDLIPESGDQCDNATDDDEDGFVNEGCPRVGEKSERGVECENDTSDDEVDGISDDDKVNDGCSAWRWTFPTGDEDPELDLEAIYTTPPVIDQTVYLGAYSGDVYALSLETGEPVWDRPFDAGDPIIAGLALGEGTLYVASDGGILYKLNAEDGSEIRRFDAGDSIWSAPLLVGEDLYVASVNGKLFKLNAETLDPVWDAPFEAEQGIVTDPVLADGTVLVGGIDRELHAVSAETGDEVWSFKADNWFWGRPLVEDGVVYAPNLDGRLFAIDLETGGKRWTFEAEDPLRSGPVLTAGVVVIVDRGGSVYGLDPEDGKRRWSNIEEDGLDQTVLADTLVLEEKDDEGKVAEVVRISAEGGDLFRLDPRDGSFVEVVTP